MSQNTKIVRVTGGLTETVGRYGVTTRGEAFEVPSEKAAVLLKDGTGRFRQATPTEAKAFDDREKAIVDARVKAATTKPGGDGQ